MRSLLSTDFGVLDPAIVAAIHVAHATGRRIVNGALARGTKREARDKGDPDIGQEAVLAAVGLAAQKLTIQRLAERFPNARFVAEEKTEKPETQPIADSTLELIKTGLTYFVDGLSGSSAWERDLEQYGISIGVAREGQHIGGVIFAPEIRGGTMLCGEVGKNVFLIEKRVGYFRREKLNPLSPPRPRKKSYVLVGSDVHLDRRFNRFLNAFSEEVRTTSGCASPALGLAMVAAGRVDALVQPMQYPWNWAAGVPIIETLGGKVRFYHYREGKIVFLKKPDFTSYSVSRRNAALIAGETRTVDWLAGLLSKTWEG